MIYQPTFDQDEDVLLLNPDPESAAFDDEDDDDFDDAEFDELGTGAASGYGEDDLADIDEEFSEDDLDFDPDLDEDIDDDLDDDSME
jgi:hypothetical protein